MGDRSGSIYYLPKPVSPADLAIMRQIDNVDGSETADVLATGVPSGHGLVNAPGTARSARKNPHQPGGV